MLLYLISVILAWSWKPFPQKSFLRETKYQGASLQEAN